MVEVLVNRLKAALRSDLRLRTSYSEQEQERCIRASSFLRFHVFIGGFASRQYVASRAGSLHPNHWSLTSPGLVPATLAALPPTRAAPARAYSSFACQAVALAKAGASSFVCLYCCIRAAKNSDGQGPEVCPSRQARDFETVKRSES